MAVLTDIVFDSADPPRLAAFWADVLDGYEVRAYTAAEIKSLAARGLTPETDPAVDVGGPVPTLFFQQSTQPKRERNRVHLDVRAARHRS